MLCHTKLCLTLGKVTNSGLEVVKNGKDQHKNLKKLKIQVLRLKVYDVGFHCIVA